MITAWDQFFEDKVRHILTSCHTVIDIGGGLRVLRDRGNRYDPGREWIRPLLERVEYKIIDPVQDYQPDLVGDIHQLPFQDNTIEAIICLAILEHVENPWLASREMHRVLKSGGMCLVYVPFLYYYHAEKGYYHDYWRFTKDAFNLLFKDFSYKETCPVRGAVETWMHISPLGKFTAMRLIARLADRVFRKQASNQVSGYYVFLRK